MSAESLVTDRDASSTPGTEASFLAQSFLARLVSALASGVLLAIAFPNFGFGLLAFIALGPLIAAAVTSPTPCQAGFLGLVSGTLSWLIQLPWVVVVMSHYGGLPYAVGVVIFIALTLLMGLYGAVFAAVVRALKLGASFRTWLVVPVLWAAVEYLRSILITGMPWDLLAAAIVDYPSLVIFDRIAGPYALGAAVMIFPTAIAWFVATRPDRRHAIQVGAFVVAGLLLWLAAGIWWVDRDAEREAKEKKDVVALIQPNISQEMRWDASNVATIFNRMMQLTIESAKRGATTIIWPESSVPLTYASTDFFRAAIEDVSRTYHADVILGSVAEDPNDFEKIWNSAYLVHEGRTAERYDKIHLVPFGEYVPLKKALFFAEKLVHAVGNFQFGTREVPLRGRVTYGPAICYEVVFPGIASKQVRNGATVLVTITNDAWFGHSSAPRQHLNSARLRAVEGDRYLLRAATTGISALIDPSGRIIQSLPLDTEGVIIGRFAQRHSTTPYVRFGDWFAIAALVASAAVLIIRRKKAHSA